MKCEFKGLNSKDCTVNLIILLVGPEWQYFFVVSSDLKINVMLLANGPNVVCQQLPTLLDVTCCVSLYTLLHVVACCWKVLRKVWNRSNFKLRTNGRNIVGSCWQTMLRPFARGLTQQNSLGGVGGGGEFSSSHRGHVSMWSLDMYYPAPRSPFSKYLRWNTPCFRFDKAPETEIGKEIRN